MVGEKLGSFRIEGTLGVGAMGVVYKAIHEPSGKEAAVKVIAKELAARGNAYDRFEREANILKQFRHPNIVRFLALGRYQGTSYIAMEFIPGRTLDDVLKEKDALPWREVVALGAQLCDALHYAHEHGVVHRDLKPSNLMVTESGTVKLTDFGIAKDLDKTALTATGRTLGTAAYMAPEQIRGTPAVSHKTDLYALGIVLYQMLTGRPPFAGDSAVVLMHAHMNAAIPRASAKVAEIPRALDDLLVKLMAKSDTDRPWDAAAVGETLKSIQAKAERGEAVPMVWPTEGVDATGATRASDTVKKGKKARRAAPSDDTDGKSRTVRLLETLGLVAALVVLGGVVAYILWPPSAAYLFRHAEALMATEERHKWAEALSEYVEPLDRRFPNHPYKATTRGWRDKVAVAEVAGRARLLESPLNTKLNQPQNPVEERWAEYFALVSAAEKRNDDLAEHAAWVELSRQYRGDDPKERPWYLYATARAEAQAGQIAQRRSRAERLLNQARASEALGRADEARSIRAEVLARDGKFTSVADLLPPADPAPAPTPAPMPPGE